MTEPALSPRLADLQQALQVDNRAALDDFWRDVKEQGTPLVDPVVDDPDHAWVTFVYRGDESLTNVVLMSGLATDGQPDLFTRLPDTDLWYRCYRVRRDIRTTYRLSPNDSLVPFSEVTDFQQRTATFQPDPRNPRQFVFPANEGIPDDVDTIVSVLELPDAPDQSWSAPQAANPTGEVHKHRFRSAVLGNERSVDIYTPPGYDPQAGPYHLLLVFDGWAYLHLVPTPVILDNLLGAGSISPVVAVLIDNATVTSRSLELPCHAPFADFLAHELLPWVRAHYRVTDDPGRTIVAGSSYGGLAATFAALRHPAHFGNVLSQSGSYWWKPEHDAEHEWLARQIVARPTLPIRWYLDVGLLEVGQPPFGGPSQVVTNRHMRNLLQAKGYDVHYAEYNGGHDYLCWRGTLADGLLRLIGVDNTSSQA